MKHLLFVLLLLPVANYAQKKADYERIMNKFMKHYNNEQIDSINMLDYHSNGHWELESVQSMRKSLGDILSFKYLGVDTSDPGQVHVFKVKTSKAGTKALSFTLDRNSRTKTFRFTTSSDEIERMLRASK